MKVLITGSSGLVGRELTAFLETGGHEVLRLVRGEPRGADEVRWDVERGVHDLAPLEGLDAVVHLAGEAIADRRWSEAQKRRIRDSRVLGTGALVDSLRKLTNGPRVFVSASAIGFYGSRGDEVLTEESGTGDDFLSGLCRDWEAASSPLADAEVRVVHLRFGVILSARGGALAKMLLPFKLGAGGRLGSGDQFMSWIAVDDAVGAVHHALTTDGLSGAVNAVAPNPVTNREYTKTLGKVLGRPTIFPMPAFAARVAFGEMADALLLSSARVRPNALLDSSYRFDWPDLEGALRHVLGRNAQTQARAASTA
ncbi:MAG: TIGR01777 family protein [bacterium]|nr:TIGR01777 family protein [bacterium]